MIHKINRTKVLALAALFLASGLIFFAWYIPKVKIYEPLNIYIEGINARQTSHIRIYGVTPLGSEHLLNDYVLQGDNNNKFLFSKIYIDCDAATCDSISAIRVHLGNQWYEIGKKEIQAYYASTKSKDRFPLSDFIHGQTKYSSKSRVTIQVFILSLERTFVRTIQIFLLLLQRIVGLLANYIIYFNYFHYFPPTVLFLVFAVLLPTVLIIRELRRNPIRTQRIDMPQTELSKYIFFICLLFFLGVQAYGIYDYKLRMVTDQSRDMLSYSGAIPFQGHLPEH